jgi:ABC-2 type transport system permease protein
MSTPETNFSNAEAPAAVAPPAGALAQRSTLKTFGTLVRRELWEHRALWVTPLAIAALVIVLAVPIRIGPLTMGAHEEFFANVENRRGVFTIIMWGQTLPQYLVMVIVLSFYLLDCLYLERKDRSILFWKSLPVSDAATVISKLLVAIVIVPLGVYLVAMVTSIIAWGIWAVRMSLGPPIPHPVAWETIAWLKVQALMLYGLLVSMGWFAPLAAFLLLVSAWARRNVFLWATLPPVVAIVAERMAFGTHYVAGLLEYRTWGIWEALGVRVEEPESHGRVVSLADLFDNVSMSKAVLNIDLWLGLAVAAAFVVAAIRIRRYRDDT